MSPVRFFDERQLALFRWVSERYVAPLATVIGRAMPPRVASEEVDSGSAAPADGPERSGASRLATPVLAGYRGWRTSARPLARAVRVPSSPARPRRTSSRVAVDAVAACLAGGRRAIVLVPEATPVPATATALLDAFGDRAALFLGGGKRTRYRRWLEIAAGRYDVVIGTRPAVFAPLARRRARSTSPERAIPPTGRTVLRTTTFVTSRSHGAASNGPSASCLRVPVGGGGSAGAPLGVARRTRVAARRGGSARTGGPGAATGAGARVHASRVRVLASPRLRRRAGLQVLRRAGGVRVVRRAAPAAEGAVACVVCGAPGRCRSCGGTSFGVRRGGAEHVEEWAGRARARAGATAPR